MVTTTSSTSSASTAATTTTTPTKTSSSSTVSSAANSVLTSLNAGSGIDTNSLVTSLVAAQFAAKTSALTTKSDTLTAQISGVSALKSAISTLSSALATLSKSGSLTTQPVSSNGAVLTASALPGAALSGLTGTVTVSQLATAHTAVSTTPYDSSSAVIGTGKLTLTIGAPTYNADKTAMTGLTAKKAPVTIDVTDGSLSGIAKAINAANAGVTASIVTDAGGKAYLSLKGETGTDQAFTLAAASSTTGDLSQIAVGPGAANSRITATAQNAKLTVDGVAVERPSNTIQDLIDGVKMQLTGTSATPVTLSSTTPTEALTNAVNDFVDSYNQVLTMVKEQTDPITGPLRSDTAAKSLLASLQGLTQKVLTPGAAAGMPTSLAAIGVRTKRDGTLEVNDASLAAAMKSTPQAVEAMFATTGSSAGLPAALASLSFNAGSTIYGLGASSLRYIKAQSALSTEQTKLDEAKASATTRMTTQFSSMNSRVAAYKSVQTFLTNQIAAWNKSDD